MRVELTVGQLDERESTHSTVRLSDHSAVRDLAVLRDHIWVGTEKGLVRIKKRAVGL